MIDRRKFALLLSMLLNTPLAIAASDCSSLINTDKDTFLSQLKSGDASSIYSELHDCVQNNFCASYSGSAACLPTLNNYTAYAAYYNSAGKSSDSSGTLITPAATAAEQAKQTQQNTQSSEVYQPAPPPTTDNSSNTTTDSSDKDNTSNGGLYEGINF